MSSSDRNPMSGTDGVRGISEGALAAIAVTLSVGTVIVLLTLYLWLYHRKKACRESLEAIGGGNLFKTPPSARGSQVVVTREVSCSGGGYGPCESTRGSYSSTQPILRGSYQSTSSRIPSNPPPRPARPSWPSSVLEANCTVDADQLTSTCAPLSKPAPVLSSLLPKTLIPPPPSPKRFLKGEDIILSGGAAGGGQVVSTYRHPTPTVEKQENFMAVRERAQVERTLGANAGMAEVGFKREVYIGYGQGEDPQQEGWRRISDNAVLTEEAKETIEWTKECNGDIGVAR